MIPYDEESEMHQPVCMYVHIYIHIYTYGDAYHTSCVSLLSGHVSSREIDISPEQDMGVRIALYCLVFMTGYMYIYVFISLSLYIYVCMYIYIYIYLFFIHAHHIYV